MADVPPGKNDVQANQVATTNQPDATAKLQQDVNNLSFGTKAARVAEVTGLGIAYSPLGVIHSIEHDLDPANWKETAIKAASALAMGVAMRTLLPEAGAVKAIVGTAMGFYFAKDAAMPIIHGWGNVTRDGSSQAMDQSAKTIGDSLGAFAFEGYATSKLAGWAGDMTPRLAERYVPEQWSALESWKAQNYGAGSPLGLKLNSWSEAVAAKARQFGDKLDPPKQGYVDLSHLGKEQLLSIINDSEKAQIAHARNSNFYKNGMTGSDGLTHGLDGTYDLLLQGQDPRKIAVASTEAPAGHVPFQSVGQVKGLSDTIGVMNPDEFRTRGTPLVDSLTDQAGDIPFAPDDAAVKGGTKGGGRKGGTSAPQGDAASPVEAGDIPMPGKDVPMAQQIMSARNMTKMAAAIRGVIADNPDQKGLVQDAINRPVQGVFAATNTEALKGLDPAYKDIYQAMRNLVAEVGDDPKQLGQVYDLFTRLNDASLQGITGKAGSAQTFVNELNVYARENHSTYARNIAQALNTTDLTDVFRSKKPPLFEMTSDLEQIGVSKDGKPVFAHQGPHTVRAIYGPNGEAIWPVDLIKYPVREEDLRGILTASIYGHEMMHDQYGSLYKLDPAQREARLTAAANKALGASANDLIDMPGKGKPVVGEDGSPMNDLDPIPAQITKRDLFVQLAKAWADETVADWGAASESGQSAAPYFQALRKNGMLMNGTMMGEEMRTPTNQLGIEAHPVDVLRPQIQSLLIRALAGGDQRLIDRADALDAYAKAVSAPSDTITLASMDTPGGKISFSKQQYLDFMGQVVQDQLHAPLPRLQGHSLFEILPDLRKNMAKTDGMADTWAAAINAGKDPATVPFDKTTTKMTHVFGAGQPTFLRLVNDGMDPAEANTAVNKFSDYFRAKYADGDPHVDPVRSTSFTKALQLTPVKAMAQIPDIVQRSIGDGIRNQHMLRDWTAKQAVPLGALGGSAMLQDLMGIKKTQDQVLNNPDNKKGS